MSATELLCNLLRRTTRRLSKNETRLFEASLLSSLCHELNSYFKEKMMVDSDLIRLMINDILSSETYTLTGIANYTYFHEDIIYDIACGSNTNPSLTLSRKIIELHKNIRPELYRQIIEKIIDSSDEKGDKE